MNTLVICKISGNRLRKQIYGKLKNRGFSTLPGIFECDFNLRELENLQKFLEGIAFGSNEYVLLFPLCSSCQKKRMAFGNTAAQIAPDDGWIII